MRARAGSAEAYPGQCVHEWTRSKDGEICAKGCGSTCRRGEDKKIESYSAGASLLRTPAPKRRTGAK